jgi:hypothetical protein
MSRSQKLAEKLARQPDWRPFAPSPSSTVRCADGLHRRRSDCVLLPEIGWVKKDDKNGAKGAESLTG